MKTALALTAVLLAGCGTRPFNTVPIDHIAPGAPPQVRAYCDYVGALHGSDGLGGIGPKAACYRYWAQTGTLPGYPF